MEEKLINQKRLPEIISYNLSFFWGILKETNEKLPTFISFRRLAPDVFIFKNVSLKKSIS